MQACIPTRRHLTNAHRPGIDAENQSEEENKTEDELLISKVSAHSADVPSPTPSTEASARTPPSVDAHLMAAFAVSQPAAPAAYKSWIDNVYVVEAFTTTMPNHAGR